MRIACPCCGLRDHTEFEYGGDAARRWPAADASLDTWSDYVYLRDNPRGLHREYWQHVHGCREWLIVTRDTLSHEISSVILAREEPLVTDDTVDGAGQRPVNGAANGDDANSAGDSQ